MTTKEVINNLWLLSDSHVYDGEVRTKEWLSNRIKNGIVNPKPHNHLLFHTVLTIELPDGVWHTEVVLDRETGYVDYYLPDTREQEEMMLVNAGCASMTFYDFLKKHRLYIDVLEIYNRAGEEIDDEEVPPETKVISFYRNAGLYDVTVDM